LSSTTQSTESSPAVKIGIVGPCAAGKTTLISALRQHGYWARHIAQEHSYVADMWQRISNPELLIYLDVSYKISMLRKPMNWGEKDFTEQVRRLLHARQHANLYIDTSNLSTGEVLQKVLDFLANVEPKP
jgi:cytidylate kinase